MKTVYILIILIFALVVEAVGVVCLSRAMKDIQTPHTWTLNTTWHTTIQLISNPIFWTGLILELIFFSCLLFLLKNAPVSIVWPLTSLGFVITTLAAKFILNEHIPLMRWIGVILIVVGAMLVSISHQPKTL